MTAVPRQLDHLVFATPNLASGIAHVQGLLGVRALPGGRHPAWGTRNALVPLGPATYLEIIGPDPERPAAAPPSLFGIDALSGPRLVTWAVKGTDLARLTQHARLQQIDLGAPSPGSRLRPDGTLLAWESTDPWKPRAGGILPFFIDWPSAGHPATIAPAEIELLDLRAQHPAPEIIVAQLSALGIELSVAFGRTPALIAELRTARGTVLLT